MQASSLGPEILTSGPGLAVLPSQIDLKINSLEYKIVDEKFNLENTLSDYRSHHVSWLKVYADNSTRNVPINETLLKQIVTRAHALNLKVAIHAEYRESIINAIKAKPDSIEHF